MVIIMLCTPALWKVLASGLHVQANKSEARLPLPTIHVFAGVQQASADSVANQRGPDNIHGPQPGGPHSTGVEQGISAALSAGWTLPPAPVCAHPGLFCPPHGVKASVLLNRC